MLNKKYIIERYFTKGEFGRFYIANDLENDDNEVLVKISNELTMNKQEYETLQRLNEISDGNDFP